MDTPPPPTLALLQEDLLEAILLLSAPDFPHVFNVAQTCTRWFDILRRNPKVRPTKYFEWRKKPFVAIFFLWHLGGEFYWRGDPKKSNGRVITNEVELWALKSDESPCGFDQQKVQFVLERKPGLARVLSKYKYTKHECICLNWSILRRERAKYPDVDLYGDADLSITRLDLEGKLAWYTDMEALFIFFAEETRGRRYLDANFEIMHPSWSVLDRLARGLTKPCVGIPKHSQMIRLYKLREDGNNYEYFCRTSTGFYHMLMQTS